MKILKAHIVHAPAFGALTCKENAYLTLENGRIEGIYDTLPAHLMHLPVEDYGDKLLIPSFSDMHLHAPQYSMLGQGMDLQLLEWLNTYTFPTEAAFSDPDFARTTYRHLAQELILLGTTRVCMYASIHRESTHILMEELERAGVTGYVGKVNMDRNSPDYLCETTEESLEETVRFIEECKDRYKLVKPILTPRFSPSCSDALLESLGKLAQKEGLRVQSHLSENLDEVAWVKSLCGVEQYYESYMRFNLFTDYGVMAHCVYSDEKERAAMAKHNVYVAHCPDSNVNIASGIAPVRRMIEEGVNVGLGSDIAAGALLNMMDVITSAVRVSKLRWLHTNKQENFLSFEEAFYLATSAGNSYFGAGAGFQKGDMLHALVLDDSMLPPVRERLPLEKRLERILYLSRGRCIAARYSEGEERKVEA